MAKKERKRQEVASDLPPVWGGEDGLKEGDVLEGIFIGSKTIKFKSKSFRTHQIQNEDTGEVLSFSGAISDGKMARIPRGAYVWITFLGMTDTANGEAKDYKIEADASVKIESEVLDIA